YFRVGGAGAADTRRGRAGGPALPALPVLRLVGLQHRALARRRGGPLDPAASAAGARHLRGLSRPARSAGVTWGPWLTADTAGCISSIAAQVLPYRSLDFALPGR